MPTSQAIQILIFLLPGFLCYSIIRLVAKTGELDGLTLTVNAILFAMLTQLTVSILPDKIIDYIGHITFTYNIDGSSTNIRIQVFGFLLSILISLLVCKSIKHDFHMKVLRKLKITNKTSRLNAWSDIFSDTTGYICINYNDGTQLQGVPNYYSDTKDEGIIVLAYASWRDSEGKTTDIPNALVMVPDLKDVVSIDFQNDISK